MTILETERLALRKFTTKDSEFILKLLNEPAFIENISDKGVRTIRDAENYILTVPKASYEKHGFGLWLIELKDKSIPIGMCGLLKRAYLRDIDVGYAILTEYYSKGYATEAVQGVTKYAFEKLGIKRLTAIVNPQNYQSLKVLDKTGFIYDKSFTMPGEETEIQLFVFRQK